MRKKETDIVDKLAALKLNKLHSGTTQLRKKKSLKMQTKNSSRTIKKDKSSPIRITAVEKRNRWNALAKKLIKNNKLAEENSINEYTDMLSPYL